MFLELEICCYLKLSLRYNALSVWKQQLCEMNDKIIKCSWMIPTVDLYLEDLGINTSTKMLYLGNSYWTTIWQPYYSQVKGTILPKEFP